MSGRKKKFRDVFASADPSDNFGTIYNGMLQSKSFQSLSIGARLFYVICRAQARSKHGTSCLFQHGKEYGIEYDVTKDFVFPSRHMELYGVDRRNGIKYLNQLENAGFIVKKECNKVRYKVNVYEFSSKWKETG